MTKIIYIFLFTLLIHLQASAQKYSIGVMASPDLTYFNDSFGKNVGGANYDTKPGYTIGLSIYKKLSKHFFVTSGLWYIDKGYKTFASFVFFDNNNNPVDTFPGTITHRYQDLDIPLLINYTLGKKKLKFTCSTGVVLGFALKETITSSTAYRTNVYNGKNYQKGPSRINLNVAIGILYKINDNYTLLFEPNYKIDVRTVTDTHSFGFRTTLIYRFKY